MSRPLVIGYGNTLRGDDGAGPAVARRVADRLPRARVLTPFQLLPEHAQDLAEADVAVLVDAAATGEPGTIVHTRVEPRDTPPDPHALDPERLLHMARVLYGRAAETHLVTIAAASLDLGETFSPPVLTALAEAEELVLGIVEGARVAEQRMK